MELILDTHTQKALARDQAVVPRIMNTTSETEPQKHQKSWDRLKSSSLKKPSVLKEGKQKEQYFPPPARLTSMPINRNNRYSKNPIQTHFQKGKKKSQQDNKTDIQEEEQEQDQKFEDEGESAGVRGVVAGFVAGSERAGGWAGGQAGRREVQDDGSPGVMWSDWTRGRARLCWSGFERTSGQEDLL
jgi:hypothetical protein